MNLVIATPPLYTFTVPMTDDNSIYLHQNKQFTTFTKDRDSHPASHYLVRVLTQNHAQKGIYNGRISMTNLGVWQISIQFETHVSMNSAIKNFLDQEFLAGAIGRQVRAVTNTLVVDYNLEKDYVPGRINNLLSSMYRTFDSIQKDFTSLASEVDLALFPNARHRPDNRFPNCMVKANTDATPFPTPAQLGI